MLKTLKSLSLGFFLTFLASLSLLISDWNRRTAARRHIPHVAILQHASTPVLDDAVRGMVDGLAKELRDRGHYVGLLAHPESSCPVDRFYSWTAKAPDGKFAS